MPDKDEVPGSRLASGRPPAAITYMAGRSGLLGASAHPRPLLARVGHRHGPLGRITYAVRQDWVEPDRVAVVGEPVVEGSPEVAIVDHHSARFDDRVDAGIDLLARKVQRTELAVGREEVRMHRGTAPLHGCFGSAI
jgi:hypothetical protein